MITWIKIKNLALVDDVEVEFAPGFNVVSGETGAGKSIIVGAISLLTGKRADKGVIRTGGSRCEVSAAFALPASLRESLTALLAVSGIEVALDPHDDLLIRRVITADSSKHYLNDTPVTLGVLAVIGDALVDFHGPHDHQSLLRPAAQLEVLDRFGGLEGERSRCAALFSSWRKAKAQLDELESGLPDAEEADRLRKLIKEIDTAAPQAGEDKALVEKHSLAANAKGILQQASRLGRLLYDSENSVSDMLGSARRMVDDLRRLDEGEVAAGFAQRIETMGDEARELARDLESYAGGVELDEAEFAALEDRLAVLASLKRKHGPTIEDVLGKAESARGTLAKLENFDEAKRRAAAEVAAREADYRTDAVSLRSRRKKAAGRFAEAVRAKMELLALPKSLIVVELAEADPGPSGIDRVELMFSANPGVPPKPLRLVASSGEMSRVMLAMKTVLAKADAVPILIFDEIDANIGGETARVVGEEMRALGGSHQVICISHLALVAAQATAHFCVSKTSKKDQTFADIELLKGERRVSEIARMLGGGKAAKKHAAEILAGLKSAE